MPHYFATGSDCVPERRPGMHKGTERRLDAHQKLALRGAEVADVARSSGHPFADARLPGLGRRKGPRSTEPCGPPIAVLKSKQANNENGTERNETRVK